MRKIFLLIIATVCCISLFSQEKVSYSAKIGSGISISSLSITPFTVEAMIHYNLTNHWAFGAGTGYGLYDNISAIPLYANVKYTINPKTKYNMFADCSAGHSFAFENGKNGGFYLNPEFGLQRELWHKTFSVAIGYQLQELERRKSNSDSYVSSQFVETLSVHSISIKLGIVF